MQHHRRVILLIEATSAYGRGCLRGVARYARVQGGWTFCQALHSLIEATSLADIRKWKGDGIIARIENRQIADVVGQLKLPTVDIRGSIRLDGVAVMITDDRKVIEMAAGHLLSNGLKHMGFCGYPGIDFSDARQDAFMRHVEVHSGTKSVFDPPAGDGDMQETNSYELRGVSDSAALQTWLQQLPKPAGVIACHDTRGRQVLEACAAAGLRVPYDVAVVGVDDDDVLCELSYPTLSSVAPNVEALGFDAAALLDRMLSGEVVPAQPVLVPPVALEVRGSSNMTALSDPVLVEAVRIIRSKASGGLNVEELLDELCISRSTLERQFRQELGCTPYEYICRCRIERVKQLLVDTRFRLSEITRMAGFCSAAHMTAVFRARVGQTPGQFRRSNA